jgi:hypothetical protein
VHVDYRLSRKVIKQFWRSFIGATPHMSSDNDEDEVDAGEASSSSRGNIDRF